jgi:hypothetical protein
MAFVTFPNKCDLSSYEYINLDLYVAKSQASSQFQLNFCTTGQDGFNYGFATNTAGWNRIRIKRTSIPKAVTSADWTNINSIRLTYFNYAQTDVGQYYCVDNLMLYNI